MSKHVQVQHGTYSGIHSDHSEEITALRQRVGLLITQHPPETATPEQAILITGLETAAALLEVHDDTGISLDNWIGPRQLVESAFMYLGLDPDATFLENGV